MNIIRPPVHCYPMPVNFNLPMYPAYGQWVPNPRPDFNHYHRLRMPVKAAPHNNPRPQQSFVPLQVSTLDIAGVLINYNKFYIILWISFIGR